MGGLSRRQVVASAAGAIAAIGGQTGFFARAFAATEPLPALFYRLSQSALGRRALPRGFAERLLPHVLKEAWAEKHIRTALSIIDDESGGGPEGPDRVAKLFAAGRLRDGEAWFVRHLVTTYYAGIYYYEGVSPVQLGGHDALIWDVLDGLITRPGQPGLVAGYWAEPPVDPETMK